MCCTCDVVSYAVHMMSNYYHRMLGRGAFGEVWAGTALDIMGPGTGPHPVALKVTPMSMYSLLPWEAYS